VGALLFVFPNTRQGSYSRGAYVRIGGNFQNVSAAWQYTR